jgi:NAD(P)-dependent dehydrogenase (short-subunit alcohol dehydrogenase family)
MAAAIPLGRLETTEDVALAALFLASDSAAWLTASPSTWPAATS